MARTYVITGITKNGTVVTVNIEGRAKPVKYDMTTRSMTSFTGRDIMRFPVGDYDTRAIRDNVVDRLLFSCLMNNSLNSIRSSLARLELYINNPELLENVRYPSNIPDSCPKGFIKWLKDNDKELSTENLHTYEMMKALEKLNKEHKEVFELLFTQPNSPYLGNYTRQHWYAIELTESQRTKFDKILKTSLKGVNWYLFNQMDRFIRKIYLGQDWSSYQHEYRPENWEELLDTDRSFQWNYDNISALGKGQWEKLIISHEDKIRKIEELSNDRFVVIVPKTLEEFTDEGNQQRNCVGHYYHDSIARGDNLVYFIRHTGTPTRSYLTNRYSTYGKETVETRLYRNEWNDDKDALELIKEIDKMITSLLSE